MFNISERINEYLDKHGFEELRPKAVLFDMDGVIYNSMPFHAKAWQESMRHFGIDMKPADAYATEGARGIDTIKIMVKKQQGKDISDEEAQRMYDLKTQLFHEFPETDIFPGVRQLMAAAVADGCKICVVTGSGQRPLINRLLRDFGEFLDLQHIVSAYDVKRGKPYPDPYLTGMKKCGIENPYNAIVIENAPLGIQAGVAANIFTIAVNSGPLDDKLLWNAGANIVLPKMTDVCTMWDKLFAGG